MTSSSDLRFSVPARLYPLRRHDVQLRLVRSRKRFRVVPAGRRSGKTERAKRFTLDAAYRAIGAKPWPDPRYFFGAPTRDQAKAIYWNDLKAMVPPGLLAERPRETDLMIRLLGGVEIWVIGMDRPERIEGRPWDGGILDEYGNMKPGAWGENVRPALSDRKGWCWLIGVPEGRNHYYELNRYALSGEDPDWESFSWVSADILDPEEVAAARRQLDELVFQQEYEASFVNFTGRAYYAFSDKDNCGALEYDPRRDIAFCFDFNVEPGVAAVCQEQRLPGKYHRDGNGLIDLSRPIYGTGVIGEVWIPQGSNTPAVCRKLLTQWGKHEGDVYCYGDATGGARGTAKVQGSDWDLIKQILRAGVPSEGIPGLGDRVHFRVPQSNPPERTRVNSVNSRCKTQSGEVFLMVDAARAPHVVRDLEGVRTLEGGSGEIDKRTNKKNDRTLTHISDALGYYIVREFPIVRNTGAAAPLVM